MIAYWPWLLLLAGPVTMIFMMRGMSRGVGAGHDSLPDQGSGRPPPAQPLTAEERTRIAQFEHDLA